MDRIARAFNPSTTQNKTCFIPYICAGDPDYATSVEICRTLVNSGIDLLEIGVPFSDPLADGKTNQLAAQRALASGMTQERVFHLVKTVRSFTDIPIIFYTYYNLVLAPGLENYTRLCRDAGVDGLLTLDCPPEEAQSLMAACQKYSLKTVFIIAPNTPADRIQKIAATATGFLYYVSRAGVTGVRSSLPTDLGEKVAEIKQQTDLPVVVGFGISTAEHVRQVAQHADGVVVGSAIVNCISETTDYKAEQQTTLNKIENKVTTLMQGLETS